MNGLGGGVRASPDPLLSVLCQAQAVLYSSCPRVMHAGTGRLQHTHRTLACPSRPSQVGLGLSFYIYVPPFNPLADASDATEASAWDPWGMVNISKRCIYSLLSVAIRTHADMHDATCTMHAASLPSRIRAGAQALVRQSKHTCSRKQALL